VPEVTLPNGIVVEMPANDMEVSFLYGEIFESNAYLKHGLEIGDGDCIFDVGANVGLFSASLAQRYRNLRLVLFEPLPATFAILERNSERLLDTARVTLVQAGVSSEPGKATFEFDPRWTAIAGAGPFLRDIDELRRSARRKAGLLTWNLAAIDYGASAGMISASTAQRLRSALRNPVLRPFTLAVVWAFWRVVDLRVRRRVQRVECELTTVSAAMRAHGIDEIDLLKVDVEGAEWAVLEGIEPGDWPRIRQLALEVHDINGRVGRMRTLLEGKGYTVVVEQDERPLLELQGLFTMYARR
jgi:hypothetical protein